MGPGGIIMIYWRDVYPVDIRLDGRDNAAWGGSEPAKDGRPPGEAEDGRGSDGPRSAFVSSFKGGVDRKYVGHCGPSNRVFWQPRLFSVGVSSSP